MGDVKYVLDQLELAFDMAGYVLGGDGELLEYGRKPNDYLLKLLRELVDRFNTEPRDQRIPGLYAVEKNIYFWCFGLTDGASCIFGPAGGEFLTASQLDAFRHRLHLGPDELRLTHFSILKLFNVICMSCYMMTGRRYEEKDLRRANAQNVEIGQGDVVDYEIYRYNADSTRSSYEIERRWLGYIEAGDVAAISERTMPQSEATRIFEGIGVMAYSDFKQAEYMVVSCVTLATRAAIRGGVPPLSCYELSDLYLQKTSECQSVAALMEIAVNAPEQFARLVHDYKCRDHYGTIIEQCKDYIARHLYHAFTITEMASDLSMNRTYLSQLFKSQTGTTLRDYIRNERLRAAENLLKYSEESVGQIAEYMQFSSAGRFCAYFKAAYQMTPAAYRDKYKVVEFVSKKLF